MGITHYAGVRRSAGQVFLYKIVNYSRTKLVAYIEHKMRKPMLNGGQPGIIEAFQITAAGFFFRRARTCVISGLHRNTNYFVTLFLQHQGGNGAVNTSAHGHEYLTFSAHNHKDTYSHKIVFYRVPKTCKLPV